MSFCVGSKFYIFLVAISYGPKNIIYESGLFMKKLLLFSIFALLVPSIEVRAFDLRGEGLIVWLLGIGVLLNIPFSTSKKTVTTGEGSAQEAIELARRELAISEKMLRVDREVEGIQARLDHLYVKLAHMQKEREDRECDWRMLVLAE